MKTQEYLVPTDWGEWSKGEIEVVQRLCLRGLKINNIIQNGDIVACLSEKVVNSVQDIDCEKLNYMKENTH